MSAPGSRAKRSSSSVRGRPRSLSNASSILRSPSLSFWRTARRFGASGGDGSSGSNMANWHGPRSHIHHVLPIKTADQIPAEVVQMGIEDDGNPRPLFVVAKNLTVANYGDILAGLSFDNIAVEHGFLVCVSDVTFTTPESAALFRSPCYLPWVPRDGALTLSDVRSPTLDCLRAAQAARTLQRGEAHGVARRRDTA